MKLPGVFDGDHIPDVFHHADQRRVSAWRPAYLACMLVGYRMTLLAIDHVFAQFQERIRETRHMADVLFQQMQYQAQRGLLADAGQARKFINCCLKNF